MAFATGYGECVSVDNDRAALNCPLYSAVSSVSCYLSAYRHRGAVRCDRGHEGAIPVRIDEGLIPVVVDRGLVQVLVVSDGLIQVVKSACLIPAMILAGLVPISVS